jgi:anti-sigma factor RsiW
MSELKCGWSEEQLVDYAAGSLDPEARGGVERHLGECARCRKLVSGQAAVWEALGGWEAPPVSEGFDRRLYERISRAKGWRERLGRIFAPAWVRLGAPAAACLLVVGLVVLHKPVPSAPPAAPEGPSVQAAQDGALRPDQIEGALKDMETLKEFDGLMRQGASNSEM